VGTVTPVTQVAQGKADTLPMSKTHTPIINAIRDLHRAEDAARGVDPYNTARLRALTLLDINTQAQRKEAEATLACFESKLELLP
jgi:hypothetical protein